MRVLVVEDQKKIASLIDRALTQEGYKVETAADGAAGLARAADSEFDLVILDLMMPKMDGLTFCRKIREQRKTVPIIVLTAKSGVEDKDAALNCGANDFLMKPFAIDDLLSRVSRLVRKRTGLSGGELQISDLSLNREEHQALRGTRLIPLTTREFALLEYLMRHSGDVVTRTMISENVWDIKFDTATNVIDVHINSLRRKIDHKTKEKLIHTIRGRGYTLKA